MVAGIAAVRNNRLIAQSCCRISSPVHAVMRQQKIDVAVRPVARVGNEQGAMAEAFEDCVLESRGIELRGDLAVGVPGALPTLGVVR